MILFRDEEDPRGDERSGHVPGRCNRTEEAFLDNNVYLLFLFLSPPRKGGSPIRVHRAGKS